MKTFIEHYSKQQNYSTHVLNVFKGVSLHDFTYYYGKFDLVIANKIYSKARKKKVYLSIRFLFKHFLHQYGILCIIIYTQHTRDNKFLLFENIKPVLEKKISLRNKNSPIHLIFYINRKKFALLGGD